MNYIQLIPWTPCDKWRCNLSIGLNHNIMLTNIYSFVYSPLFRSFRNLLFITPFRNTFSIKIIKFSFKQFTITTNIKVQQNKTISNAIVQREFSESTDYISLYYFDQIWIAVSRQVLQNTNTLYLRVCWENNFYLLKLSK